MSKYNSCMTNSFSLNQKTQKRHNRAAAIDQRNFVFTNNFTWLSWISNVFLCKSAFRLTEHSGQGLASNYVDKYQTVNL